MDDRSSGGDDLSADFDSQGASARPGGEARGGIDPQADDAASPAAAERRSAAAQRDMRERGFGDDKGADIG